MKQRFTEASTPTEEDLRGWKGYQVGRCWQSETSRKNHPLPAAFLLSEIKNSNELGPMFEQNLFKFIQTEIYSDTSLVADAFDNITPSEIEDLYSNNFIKNTNIERLTEGYVTLKGILENPGIVAPATVQETFGEPAYVSEYVNKIKYKQGIFSYTGKYRARIEVKRYGPYMLTYLPKHIDSSNLFCYFFKSIGNGEPEKGALFELFNPTRASNTENHVIVVPQGTYKIVSHHLDPQNRQAYYIIRVPNVGDVSVYASRGRVKRK